MASPREEDRDVAAEGRVRAPPRRLRVRRKRLMGRIAGQAATVAGPVAMQSAGDAADRDTTAIGPIRVQRKVAIGMHQGFSSVLFLSVVPRSFQA